MDNYNHSGSFINGLTCCFILFLSTIISISIIVGIVYGTIKLFGG